LRERARRARRAACGSWMPCSRKGIKSSVRLGGRAGRKEDRKGGEIGLYVGECCVCGWVGGVGGKRGARGGGGATLQGARVGSFRVGGWKGGDAHARDHQPGSAAIEERVWEMGRRARNRAAQTSWTQPQGRGGRWCARRGQGPLTAQRPQTPSTAAWARLRGGCGSGGKQAVGGRG
jgi:hypothetical protein